MGVLNRLRDLVGGSDHELRTYRCEDCGTTFDADAERSDVECPGCGAAGAVAVPRAG